MISKLQILACPFQAEKRCQYGQQAPTSSPKDTKNTTVWLKISQDRANPNALQMDDSAKRHFQVRGDQRVLS